MFEIKGKYGIAKVFTDVIEESAIEQIQTLCNQSFVKNSKIRIMPDVHRGKGSVIGFTAELKDKIIPNIVGVDIGCGMLCVELQKMNIDFEMLDDIIKTKVPSGRLVHKSRKVRFDELQDLYCYRYLKDTKRIERSIGTLGGGNHFIEIDQDDEGHKYLIIHTGSRHLGKQVAEHYQNLAFDLLSGKDELYIQQEKIIHDYKEQGRRQDIQSAIEQLHKDFQANKINIPKDLCYLEGQYKEYYLHDMYICQKYASINRQTIANIILEHLCQFSLNDFYSFETIHNYIDPISHIIRKGAVSATLNERLLIPMNMRDGSLICIGKGNPDWNDSAPHGAGRLYSRMHAKETFTIKEFQQSMEGIYTTSIHESTLDECPMAYKSMKDIICHIDDTVTIKKMIKPIYNYKA